MSASIRKRANDIAKAWANGTSIYSDDPDLAAVIVRVLSRQVALTASGRVELERLAKRIAKRYQ